MEKGDERKPNRQFFFFSQHIVPDPRLLLDFCATVEAGTWSSRDLPDREKRDGS